MLAHGESDGECEDYFLTACTPKTPQQMAALPVDDIRRLSDLHPKPVDIGYQYGTAGFRTSCVLATFMTIVGEH